MAGSLSKSEETASRGLLFALFAPSAPTISTGPSPPTVAGPYAAWMPRESFAACSVMMVWQEPCQPHRTPTAL
ncbi:hypothetical protein FLG15_10200 [Xanthomonas phaseoli pv. dieffenbachiae]